MKIIEAIGLTVEDIKYTSVYNKAHGLQVFNSYWKLSNGSILTFPTWPDQEVCRDKDQEYFLGEFQKGTSFTIEIQNQIIGKTIQDFHFSYYLDEIEDDMLAYIELDNGVILWQNSFAQQGVNHTANMVICKQKEFEALNTDETKVKSFLKDIK